MFPSFVPHPKQLRQTNESPWGKKKDLEQNESTRDSESEEEAIVVTRQEEQINPEDEAEFEREYAKMIAESLESRKFDRKQQFDLPLPLRSKQRETSAMGEVGESPAEGVTNTMAFSLLTKKGNRQQVCTYLPSDPFLLPQGANYHFYRRERLSCLLIQPLLLP